MIGRIDGWEGDLLKALERWKGRAFDWGDADCLLLCGDIVFALTGQDLAAKYRGKYNSRTGAARLLPRGEGEGRVAALLDSHFKRCGVGFARRGDIVFFPDAGDRLFRGCAAPVDLSGRFAVVFEDGFLSRRKVSDASIAWRVG